METFIGYIKYRAAAVALWLVFSVIYAVVFALFRVPAEAVLYGGAICFFIGIGAVFFDFRKFRRKHMLLKDLIGEISLFTNNLPDGDNLIEEDLTALIMQLSDDKKAVENEMQAKYTDMTEYYTMWAHQIKTPIAAMRLTLQNEDTQQSRELAGNLQRIEQYVEMVMCYLRLDSRSTDFMIKKYDLDDIIRQAVRKFSSQFIRGKISLIYTPLNCTALTDEKWLLFVIEQVISNALKYTKAGSIEIYLDEPKVLCIRDTGIGIAAEDLPRIFEKGYTGYNGRSDKRASGIGLYLCKKICDKLGHNISAYSERGYGTTIKIDLLEADIEIE